MPIRVLDNGAGGTLLDIFLGIRYAADNGANIINLSLSLRSHSDMIDQTEAVIVAAVPLIVVREGPVEIPLHRYAVPAGFFSSRR